MQPDRERLTPHPTYPGAWFTVEVMGRSFGVCMHLDPGPMAKIALAVPRIWTPWHAAGVDGWMAWEKRVAVFNRLVLVPTQWLSEHGPEQPPLDAVWLFGGPRRTLSAANTEE